MNNTINNTHNAHKKKLKYLAQIAILSAISAIIMLLEFPLWFAPPFYKLDFSEVPILIGSFAMGPISGILMELLKNLLNLILNGTTTNFVGEFANFITGCALVVPAALIYKYKRTFAGAIIGILVMFLCCIFSVFYLAGLIGFLALHFYEGNKGEENRLVNYLVYPVILMACGLMMGLM